MTLFSFKQENKMKGMRQPCISQTSTFLLKEIIDFKKFCYANFYHLRTHVKVTGVLKLLWTHVIVERGGDNHVRH